MGHQGSKRTPLRAIGGRLLSVSDLPVSPKSEFDLLTEHGVLLLKAGSPITPAFIQRLHDRGTESVLAKRPSHGQDMTHRQSSNTPAPGSLSGQSSLPDAIRIDATESLFAINELITAKAKAPTYSERNARTDERYAFDEEVALGYLDTDHLFAPICDAWGMDISNQGAGLLTELAIPVSERLIIRLNRPRKKTYLFTHVKIVRCKPLVGQIHLIGALFVFND